MSLKLVAKKTLSQKIALTPALKKSIDLLQLSKFELLERISDACQENPFLNNLQKDNVIADFSFDIPENASLQESILKQIPDIFGNSLEQDIAKNLTYCLDENGFLELDSLEGLKKADSRLNVANLNELIDTLQENVEPAGIFARNNRENIYLQCQRRKLKKELLKLIEHLLFDFGGLDFESILNSVKNNFSGDLIDEATLEISKCDLSPGLNFQTTREIRPDLNIKVSNAGEIDIAFIKEDMPDIVFDDDLLTDFKGADSLNEKTKILIDQAKWFISAIENRNKTLEKVGIYICLFQRDFILGNRIEPSPLSNKDIAKELNISPSTVSRIIREKFILVNGKNLSLKNFLIPSVSKTKKLSPNDFIQEISKVIASSRVQLSDQKITNLLNIRGFNIARRTVAKYRNLSGLKNSRKRK
jgi:RNA polymerase sigma-54 factor